MEAHYNEQNYTIMLTSIKYYNATPVLHMDYLSSAELDAIRDNLYWGMRYEALSDYGAVVRALSGADNVFSPQYISNLLGRLRTAGRLDACHPNVLEAIVAVLDFIDMTGLADKVQASIKKGK